MALSGLIPFFGGEAIANFPATFFFAVGWGVVFFAGLVFFLAEALPAALPCFAEGACLVGCADFFAGAGVFLGTALADVFVAGVFCGRLRSGTKSNLLGGEPQDLGMVKHGAITLVI